MIVAIRLLFVLLPMKRCILLFIPCLNSQSLCRAMKGFERHQLEAEALLAKVREERTERIEEFEREKQSFSEERTSLLQERDRLEEEKARSEHEWEKAEKEKNRLREEIRTLRESIQHEGENNAANDTVLEERNELITQLRGKLSDAEDELRRVEKERDEEREEKNKLRAEQRQTAAAEDLTEREERDDELDLSTAKSSPKRSTDDLVDEVVN